MVGLESDAIFLLIEMEEAAFKEIGLCKIDELDYQVGYWQALNDAIAYLSDEGVLNG